MIPFHFHVEYLVQLRCRCSFSLMAFPINEKMQIEKEIKLCQYIKVDQQSATVVLTWNLSVYIIIWVLFGLVVVWLTNLHSCLNISYMKDRRKGCEVNSQTTKRGSFVFFPHPLSSSSLKVPAVSLPSFQRMTLSPMTRVTPTAAAVRAMTSTRRRSCWMSRWKGRPAPPMQTVQPRLLAPCSGQWETPQAREPLVVLPPAPQHQRVSWAFFCLLYLWNVCSWFKKSVTKTECISLPVMIFVFFHSKLHRADIYWPDQPTSLQCHQLKRRRSSSSTGG